MRAFKGGERDLQLLFDISRDAKARAAEDYGICTIEIFMGAGVGTTSKPPPPTNNFCLDPPSI